MDAKFWISAWHDGRTAFHQSAFHPKLLQYFPEFGNLKGKRVLVPLCGKTKDLLWLRDQGLTVLGVELATQAVEEFYAENGLAPSADLSIFCGDLFNLPVSEKFDFVYDRASLVALPTEMRKDYAQVIMRSLRAGGKYLLIAYAYDQALMPGPPFSVSAQEIEELYQDQFHITCLENSPPANEGDRLTSVKSLRQTVYLLEKKLTPGA